jgi:hypothetical protein
MFLHVFYNGNVDVKEFSLPHEAWNALYKRMEELSTEEVYAKLSNQPAEANPFFWRKITKDRTSHLSMNQKYLRGIKILQQGIDSWYNSKGF